MRRSILSLFLLSCTIGSLYAEGPLDDFAGKSLAVHIVTRVLGEDSAIIWDMESNEVTISGQTVKVTLNGEKIRILAELTPYRLDDGSILLVAEGNVLMSSDSEGLQYKTTLKSLPVQLGEKTYFFPLGVAFDSQEIIYNIQLEIQVDEVTDPAEGTSQHS